MNDRLLKIYLRDHLAGSMAGIQLARRMHRENRDTPLGDYLAELVPALQEERKILQRVLAAVGGSSALWKELAAAGAEVLGRLKLNGHLVRYSELSRLVELEGLSLGVEGACALWILLRRLQRADDRLARFDFDALVQRKERQRGALERFRLQAGREAFVERPHLPATQRYARSET